MAISVVGAPVTAGRRLEARSEPALMLAALAWVAGFAHAAAGVEHVHEWPLAAAFFAVLALGQLALGAVLWARPTAGLLRAGAVGSVAVAALWLASRTAGLPFGPTPGRPEAIGVLDVTATLDELLLAACIVVAGRSGGARLPSRGALPLALIASLTAMMLAGGHAH